MVCIEPGKRLKAELSGDLKGDLSSGRMREIFMSQDKLTVIYT